MCFLQEYIEKCRHLQLIVLEQVASTQRQVLRRWATAARYLRLHSTQHDVLSASTALGSAGDITTAWRSICAASQLRATLLQRRALHAWKARIAEKAFWRNTLAHASSAIQQAACMRCFLAWRELTLSMRAKLAAFVRKQRALRSALAAGRALARLHHSELLAACMHAWHARAGRRIRSRALLQRAVARSVARCWHGWVKHVASRRALDSVRCAVEASRRRRTFQKILITWRGVVLVSEQAREEAAAAAVEHMREWRSSVVFVAWVSLARFRRELVLRAQVLHCPPRKVCLQVYRSRRQKHASSGLSCPVCLFVHHERTGGNLIFTVFGAVQAAMECAVILKARELRHRAWAAWIELVIEWRRKEVAVLQAAQARKSKLLESCFDSWCMCATASLYHTLCFKACWATVLKTVDGCMLSLVSGNIPGCHSLFCAPDTQVVYA